MSITHEQILGRLEAIEKDLGDRQEHGEDAAGSFYQAKRDFEVEWAQTYVQQEGTVTDRKQATILALYQGDNYKQLVIAEAAYEGWKAAMRTLEARSMIGMALLKASTREAPQSGQQPSWRDRSVA